MPETFSIQRRTFLKLSSLLPTALLGCGEGTPVSAIEEFLKQKMERDRIPGLAAALIRADGLSWYCELGYADLERRIPMSIDHLQNIGSVSKTFTTMALMQLWEKELFQLDDDVSEYVGFSVRNPNHPDVAITFRHLLTHRSSIRDGLAYGRNYHCGDPTLALGDWIRGYLSSQGNLYDPEENFHKWAPETDWEYNNVAYGLLAYLVEVISGVAFADFCKANIFEPLGMTQTSWYLADVDTSRHAAPYTLVERGGARGPSWGGTPLGVVGEERNPSQLEDGFHANCLYNHPNFPDGFLRTSIRQISRCLQAYLNRGALNGVTLLQAATLSEMWQEQLVHESRVQGLTWYAEKSEQHELLWGHGGSDPGINTDVRLRFSDATAAVVFTNTNGIRPSEASEQIMLESENL